MPLEGIRVVEAATLFAAPLAAMMLGDYGADVIKIEHPHRVDPARGHGPSKDGIGLWFKALARNKRLVTLDLSKPAGADIFLRLAERSDVVLENFRPGTLERWGVGWDELSAVNPRLVLARVSGFGQTGPYAQRAGFGTLAEAMSGFAVLNGEPDGPPLLPPLALADGVTALATAFAIMAALRAREQIGRGQIVDTSLVEPLLTLLGPQLTAFDLLGELQPRTGNRSSHNAPRNVYRTADGSWVAVSSSADLDRGARDASSSAGPISPAEPWFATGSGRAEHVDEIDDAVAAWIGERTRDDVLAAFEAAGCAIAPVYDARDVLADPQLEALGSISTVEDIQLGPLRMPNVISRLSETPGRDPPLGRPARRRHRGRLRRARHQGGRARPAPRRPGRVTVPPLTWLYVPADRPDRVEKAIASRAHAVIVDLEDAVAPGAKAAARAGLAALLTEPRDKPVYVRVNAGSADDLEAVASLALSGIVVPKVARPEDVPATDLPVHCLIESAAGLEAAYAIASTRGRRGDLARRGRPALRDGCARGRARLGPRQDRQRRRRRRAVAPAAVRLPAHPRRGRPRPLLRPRPRARPSRPHGDPSRSAAGDRAGVPADGRRRSSAPSATVERLGAAAVGTLGDGEFVDAAMLGAARQTVALAELYGTATHRTRGDS